MLFVADQPERLDKFLARMLPEHSRSKLVREIESGNVLVNGVAAKPSLMLASGSNVTLEEPSEATAHDLTPAAIPLDIVYEDDWMLVVNKPRGLATHPALSLKEPSLVNALLARNTPLSEAGGAFRPGIVHRLDKETTGLLVVAKTDAAHVVLARQIEARTAGRRYVAVVEGWFPQAAARIEAPLARSPKNRLLMTVEPAGKPAVTHIRRVGRVDAGCLLECRLETGRTHQIRVHLQAVGHPVVGDVLYGRGIGPMQLHAWSLALEHPSTGERMTFTRSVPDDFVNLESLWDEVVAGLNPSPF